MRPSTAHRTEDPAVKRAIREIAKREHLDEQAAARKLILQGKRRLDEEHVLQLFRQGRISSGRAAEMLGVPLHEVLELIAAGGLASSDETVDEFKDGLRRLRRS